MEPSLPNGWTFIKQQKISNEYHILTPMLKKPMKTLLSQITQRHLQRLKFPPDLPFQWYIYVFATNAKFCILIKYRISKVLLCMEVFGNKTHGGPDIWYLLVGWQTSVASNTKTPRLTNHMLMPFLSWTTWKVSPLLSQNFQIISHIIGL